MSKVSQQLAVTMPKKTRGCPTRSPWLSTTKLWTPAGKAVAIPKSSPKKKALTKKPLRADPRTRHLPSPGSLVGHIGWVGGDDLAGDLRCVSAEVYPPDQLRAEVPPNDVDGDRRIEVLAREDVEVGISARVAEMPRHRGGLDQLHQGVTGSLRQVGREVLQDRLPVCHHAYGRDEVCTKPPNSLRITDGLAVARRAIEHQVSSPHSLVPFCSV